jgi:hypothetical protein
LSRQIAACPPLTLLLRWFSFDTKFVDIQRNILGGEKPRRAAGELSLDGCGS